MTPNRASASQRAAFLFGDSHSAHIKHGVEAALTRAGFTLSWLGITGQSCSYLYNAGGICLEVRSMIRSALETHLQPGDLVIVAHAKWKYMSGWQGEQQRNTLRDLYVNVLQPRGANLVMVGDPPQLSTWAAYCLQAPINCRTGSWENDANLALQPLANEFTGVTYISIWGLFCDANYCYPQVPGTTTWAYWDNSHLTRGGSLYLWPYIGAHLEAAGFV